LKGKIKPVKIAHRCKGQSLTEFALILPLLLVVAGSAVDFGLLFFASSVVQNAAREGARVAATLPDLPSSDAVVACPGGDARICNVVGGEIPNISLFSGFTATYQGPTDLGTGQQTITVTISGDYKKFFFIPLLAAPLPLLGFSSFPPSVSISRSTTMRWEWQ
jgi:hypothetical protein